MIITPSQIKAAAEVLKLLHENRESVGEFLEFLDVGLFNIKTKTLGGKVFWKNVLEVEGWRLQENKVMKNCRILDPENNRIAWGGHSAMLRAFEQMSEAHR
jgi:hypothetical protein